MTKKRTIALRKKQDYQDRYIIRMQGGKAGLVEATSRMDIHEFRVFMAMLTMVLPDDDDFAEYEIRTQDIIKLYSLSDDGRYYDAIRDAAERLFNKRFVIYEKKEDGEIYKTTIHLIDETSEPVKKSEKNRIRLKFNPKLKPYLLELQREYLTIDIRNIADVQSPTSVKMYLILKHQFNLGNHRARYSVARLREILAIQDNEYPMYGNFKQKILQKTINDFEKYTDLVVTQLEEEKVGRAVDAVIFHLEEKKAPKQLEQIAKKLTRQVIKSTNGSIVVASRTQDFMEEITPSEVIESTLIQSEEGISTLDQLYENVRRFRIAKNTLKKWLDNYSEEQVKRSIDYVIAKIDKGEKIKSVGGYIYNRIKDADWGHDEVAKEVNLKPKGPSPIEIQKAHQLQNELEKLKVDLQKEYFQERLGLVQTLVQDEQALIAQLMMQLKNDNSSENPNILAELAQSNYQLYPELDQVQEFLVNFDKGGIFQGYMFEKVEKLYPTRFAKIREEFQSKALKIGLSGNVFF
ncbi:MAG: replication initiation protein [Flectobacillus sp.]|uniref:replication initiation protein n=1 Tax=Flectobacillus sp. TaxID=50419 RepID=UPI003B98EE1A